MIFWKILLAHALTDFVFQPDFLAENKGSITALLAHVLIGEPMPAPNLRIEPNQAHGRKGGRAARSRIDVRSHNMT